MVAKLALGITRPLSTESASCILQTSTRNYDVTNRKGRGALGSQMATTTDLYEYYHIVPLLLLSALRKFEAQVLARRKLDEFNRAHGIVCMNRFALFFQTWCTCAAARIGAHIHLRQLRGCVMCVCYLKTYLISSSSRRQNRKLGRPSHTAVSNLVLVHQRHMSTKTGAIGQEKRIGLKFN